jgi:hypothetical protein
MNSIFGAALVPKVSRKVLTKVYHTLNGLMASVLTILRPSQAPVTEGLFTQMLSSDQ